MSRTQTFRRWAAMLNRCMNQRAACFKNYGGRGIKVCERWMRFENFYADMGDCPPGLSLDRIDNDGNYEPANCRWATIVEQARNKRNTVLIAAFGVKRTIEEWSRETGLPWGTIYGRAILRSWPGERAVSQPSTWAMVRYRGGTAHDFRDGKRHA